MAHEISSSTSFTSWIMGRSVRDAEGKWMGSLKDFLVEPVGVALRIRALVLRDAQGYFQVPGRALSALEKELPLREPASAYLRTPVPDEDLRLVRDILDAQLIDMHGAKVVRVNDIQLDWIDDQLLVSGVDIGLWGLARRLGLAHFFAWIASVFRLRIPEGLIPWIDVVPVEKGCQRLRLQVPWQEIRGLHPADLADIMLDFGHEGRHHILSALSAEQVADIVESSDAEIQVSLMQGMEEDRAAAVLDAMEPDEAADVLGELPKGEALLLITLMTPAKAQAVRHLLTYRKDTAGGLMTTSYVAVDEDLTVGEALRRASSLIQEAEVIAYVYLINKQHQLSGVVSIRRILLAEPRTPMRDLSVQQLLSANARAACREVVELIQHYKLAAIPVTDDETRLVGVIAVNDVLEYVEAALHH